MSEQQAVDRAGTEAEAERPDGLADALGDPEQLVEEIQETLGQEPLDGGQGPDEQTVAPMELHELHASPSGAATVRDLDLLADVEVEVTVEFGRTAMPLRQLLQLRRGSLVELGRRPEEQVTVLANGTPIAYGDIVVVGDQVGVHIVELVDPHQPPPLPLPPAQVDVVDPAPAGGSADGVAAVVDPADEPEPTDAADGGA